MADPAFTWTEAVRPICEIGMSDVREAEPDTWLDVSCHVHEVEIFRGRERFNDHFTPATASITFDNRTGWGDLVGAPLIVAGQTLRPARPIRVGVRGVFDDETTESTRWLYRGWIDQATPAYDPVLHDVVTVNCIDAFGEAGQSVAPTGAEQGVNETVTARVNRTLDAVGWFGSKRKIGTVATTVQGTALGSRAVDLMTAAADSAGGVVFGDLDGDVVLKPSDWMLYDPDDPPDGEIGNMDPGDPELVDTPVYVDPDEGTVYEPAPPPMVRPPIVQFCVREGEPDGTIVEQGDSWRIYAAGGHLFYESSGRTWDMGVYDGEGCSTVFPPGDEGEPPEVIDECPAGMMWDSDLETCVEATCPEGEVWDPIGGRCITEGIGEFCPDGMFWDDDLSMCVVVPPVSEPNVPGPGPGPRPPREPGTEIDPTTVFTVELLGWDDHGLDEPPATGIDPIPITPGTDCVLVVLVNALPTISNTALLTPAVNGGGLDWAHNRHADQAGEGAASFIMLAQVGRDDPGTFDVTVEWQPGLTTRSHIATVWKVTNAVNDYVEKFDAGTVLYAVVDSNPPEEGQPGDGPQTVTLAADRSPDGVPALTRPVDITIAQSLAEEGTEPFGALFDDTDGPWIIPDNTPPLGPVLLEVASWSDDFERTELGADWELGPPTSFTDAVELFTIDTGAAVSNPIIDTTFKATASMIRSEPTAPGDQSIEIEVDGDFWQSSPPFEAFIEIYNFVDPATGGRRSGSIIYDDEGVTPYVTSYDLFGNTTAGTFGDPIASTGAPFTLRLDSYADGRQVLSFDGVIVVDAIEDEPIGAGTHQGVMSQWTGGTSPRILQAVGNGIAARKTSWVAGWRQGVASNHVSFSDVNLGPSDIQSAQAALVLESAEAESGWRILGHGLHASPDGTTPSGSFTFNNPPKPEALILVLVGLTAPVDIVDHVTVTGSVGFFLNHMQPKTGLSWGQGAIYSAVAPADVDLAGWAVTVNHPAVESVSAVVYEIVGQDRDDPIGAYASKVLGDHSAGSVDGSEIVSFPAAPDVTSIAFGYLHVAAEASPGSGAEGGAGWVEELEYASAVEPAYFHTMSRVDSTATLVGWADVQTGTADTSSGIQMIVEIRTDPAAFIPATPYGPITIGGATDPYNGPIDYIALFDPVTGEPILGFP